MKFCPTCKYYLYLKAGDNELTRQCVNCGYKETEVNGGLISETLVQQKSSEAFKIMINEFTRQPIEELWMGGRVSLAPKVKDRAHQWPAHVPHPDVVGCNAGSERIVWVGDPAGQAQAAARTGWAKGHRRGRGRERQTSRW